MATIVRTMMVNWSIRRAAPKDATALANCLDGAYAQYARRITDMPSISQGIEREIEDNLVWVGEWDNEIIGGIILAVKHDHGVVKNVAVGPSARGTGLGRALLDLAENEARRMGFEKMRLTTHVAMPENVRLYEHLGWHEAERLGDKVRMEKRIVVVSGGDAFGTSKRD